MAKRIIVRNSHIEITEYEGNSKLEHILSAWDDKMHCPSIYAFIRKEDSLVIPSGFSLNYLKKILPDYKVIYSDKSDPYEIAVFKINTDPRDKRQQTAIDFLSGSKDFYYLSESTQKILALGTSIGKTYCTINYMSQRNVRTLVIVDRKLLSVQWMEEFMKFSNLKETDFFFISGKQSISKLMKKKNPQYKVYIAIHRTLQNLLTEDEELLVDLFNHMKIGLKVVDEMHLYFENILKIDMITNTMETVYLSATPGRSAINENKLFTNCFNDVPTFGLAETTKNNEKYINLYYVRYNSKPSSEDLIKSKNYYGFNINQFSSYSFVKKAHVILPILSDLIGQMFDKELKVAIIVHTLEQVKILKGHLLDLDYSIEDIGIFCGLTKDDKLADEADKRILITTDKMLGSALTIPELRCTIMTVPTSSEIVIKQIMGRLRKIGKTCFFMILTDYGFDACKKQRTKISRTVEDEAKNIFNVTKYLP